MNKRQLKKMRDKLAQIEKRDGRLTPEAVVTEARNPKSVLHRMFEWDDSRAAHRYRLDQARELIVSVTYVFEREGHKHVTPLYVKDPDVGHNEQGYRSVVALRTDRDLAHEALVGEFARAAAILKRAHDIARALNFLEEETAAVAASVGALHTRVSTLELDPS